MVHYHKFIYNYCNKYGIERVEGEGDFNYWPSQFPQKYSVIVVDECQDYRKEWIDSLHKGLKNPGIMIFAADERQTIYNVDNKEKNSDKIYTGVGGNWPKAFNRQYPSANKIQKMLTAFKNEFILTGYADWYDSTGMMHSQ